MRGYGDRRVRGRGRSGRRGRGGAAVLAAPWLGSGRERKRERKGRPMRKTGLDTNNHDAKLDVKIYGAKLGSNVPVKSLPCLRRAQDLDAKIYGTETCKLGATNDDAKLRV